MQYQVPVEADHGRSGQPSSPTQQKWLDLIDNGGLRAERDNPHYCLFAQGLIPQSPVAPNRRCGEFLPRQKVTQLWILLIRHLHACYATFGG